MSRKPQKPTPKNWPRFSSCLFYKDANGMIDWLVEAFGFEIRIKIVGDDGMVHHSELEYAEGLIQVGQEGGEGDDRPWKRHMRSPLSVDGANTQCVMFFVDDVDAHCAHARAKGATIVEEPFTSDYGEEYWTDRSYAALDPEGNLWWVTQRLRG